jgi:cell division control protein 6
MMPRHENIQDREDIPPPTTPKKSTTMSKTTGMPLTPVSGKRTISLFTPSKRILSTPTKAPTTPSTPSTPVNTIFTHAKSVLRRGTVPGKLAARCAERTEITSFLSQQFSTVKRGGFLYICGPPGTGKTALMNEIVAEYRECPSNMIDLAFINCMSFDKPDDVFERIIEELGGKISDVDSELEMLLIKRKIMSYVLSVAVN